MQTVFTGHLAWKFQGDWTRMDSAERNAVVRQSIEEVTGVFARREGRVTLRGAYLTKAFRADTDVLWFMYGPSADEIQDLVVDLGRTRAGRSAHVPWSFVGVTAEAEFNKAHTPAFLRGVPPKKYLRFYPFIRTPEWYLLPADERALMLKEHGEFGREFPEVRTNNVHAFGLGDYEWLLSFETDDLALLMRMVRRQREARARAYTKHEWPFIVGRRFEVPELFERL